jgi:hypothetical protein
MNENQEVHGRKRRSSEEVQRLVLEFKASGLRRKEFCQARGMALTTLRRHLKNRCLDEGGKKTGSRLAAVELAKRDRNAHAEEASAALEVVLSSGRRIAVRQRFDSATLGRLVKVLEGL